jgi:hypothetical protein
MDLKPQKIYGLYVNIPLSTQFLTKVSSASAKPTPPLPSHNNHLVLYTHLTHKVGTVII